MIHSAVFWQEKLHSDTEKLLQDETGSETKQYSHKEQIFCLVT